MDGQMIDDEDDILLEGSPLYQYLKDTCPDEHFKSFPQPCESNISPASNGDSRINFMKQAFMYALQSWQTVTSKLFSCLSLTVEPTDFVSYLNYKALPKYCSLASSSRCVTSPNTSVLDSYLHIYHKHPKVSRRKLLIWIFVFFLVLCIHILLLLSICQSAVMKDWSRTEAAMGVFTLQACVLALVTYILLRQVAILLKFAKLWRDHRWKTVHFSHFLTMHTSFGDMLKRAILFVQEVEVIQRGYTMMTPFTPICHLERGNQTQLQCPVLRQAIFQAARNQFLSLRQAMLATLSFSPLKDEICGGTEDVYLATTDLHHLAGESSILTDDSLSPQPTSHLKAIANLYSDQLSEFIIRYLIGQCPDLLTEPTDHTQGFSQMLDEAVSSANGDLHNLQTSLDRHRPMTRPLEEVDQTMGHGEQRLQEIWGPHDVLASAARALRLHADIITKSADTLQTDVPARNCNTRLIERDTRNLEQLLSKVKGHLEACQACVHEAGVAVAKLSGRVEQTPSKHPDADEDGSNMSQPSKPSPEPIDLMALKEPEIDFVEEEIFEAYIDPERDDKVPDYDMDDMIEERGRRKKESDDAKHLLVELHSVLSRREEEKEKIREERRRLKGGGGTGRMADGRKSMESPETGQDGARGEGDADGGIAGGDIGVALCGTGSTGLNLKAPCSGGSSDGDLNDPDIVTATRKPEEPSHTCSSASGQTFESGGLLRQDSSVYAEIAGGHSNHTQYTSCDVRDEANVEELSRRCTTESGPESLSENAKLRHDCEVPAAVCSDSSGFGEKAEMVIQRPIAKPRKSLQAKCNSPCDPCKDTQMTNVDAEPPGDASMSTEEASRLRPLHRIPSDLDNHKEETVCGVKGEEESEGEESQGVVRWGQQHMAIPFMQGLAAEAVRMSRERQSFAEDTFGD